MEKDRTPREEIEDQDLLKPIDVLSLGSDDDPCFGKHHDLLASECKQCGDADFCAIVKSQGLHNERLGIETKKRFKDIEEADEEILKKKDKAKVIIDKYKKDGFKRIKTILIVSRELGLPKNIIKQIYDQN
jgi:hypothetical protein